MQGRRAERRGYLSPAGADEVTISGRALRGNRRALSSHNAIVKLSDPLDLSEGILAGDELPEHDAVAIGVDLEEG